MNNIPRRLFPLNIVHLKRKKSSKKANDSVWICQLEPAQSSAPEVSFASRKIPVSAWKMPATRYIGFTELIWLDQLS